MEQSELLQFLARTLKRLKLPYLITGSTVTIFYGEPRFTNDIDVVVQLPANAIRARAPGTGWEHLRDIAGVLKTSGAQLDLHYIEQWATKLGLSEIWQAIRAAG